MDNNLNNEEKLPLTETPNTAQAAADGNAGNVQPTALDGTENNAQNTVPDVPQNNVDTADVQSGVNPYTAPNVQNVYNMPGGQGNAYAQNTPQGVYNNASNSQQMPPPVPQQNMQVPKEKSLSKGWIIGIVIFIVLMFCITILLSAVILKNENAGETNNTDGSFNIDKHTVIDITIPTNKKPVIEPKYYEDESTGLLTSEGVAQKVMPSQVLVGVYSEVPYRINSWGSGIILTSDGYILTNAHVVDGGNKFKVTLNDGTQKTAELIGIDRLNDIAVVKIDAKDLIPAEIGDSDSVVLGEEVAVIGTASDLENSISFGHISGLDREIMTDYEASGILNCIQTDAALNPGNSGGALVNMYGQVIGLSVAGESPEYFDGIGFAIEINDVIPIAESLIEEGYVPGRARLGITFFAIDAETAMEYDIPFGLCIQEIDPECDIANHGLQKYDIITKMDGVEVHDSAAAFEVLGEKSAGDTITLTIYRKTITDEELEFEVEVKLEQKYDFSE